MKLGKCTLGSILCLALQPPVCALADVTIGILTDLSGSAAYIGQQTRRGAELAKTQLRADGRAVSLLFEDHRMKTDLAVSAASKLFLRDGADALFCQLSQPSIAVSPVALQAGRLMIYSAAATSILEANPLAFKTLFDFAEGCRSIAAEWKIRGLRRIAVLGPTHEATQRCAVGTHGIFPSFTREEFFTGDDLRSSLLRLKAANIEAVLIPSYEGDITNAFKSASTIGYAPLFGVSSDSFGTKLRASFPALSARTTGFGLAPPGHDFVEALKTLFPETPDTGIEHAELAYLAVKQLAAAVEGCPKGDVKCQAQALMDSPAEPTLGFLGWRDRRAMFQLKLYRYDQLGAEEETPGELRTGRRG